MRRLEDLDVWRRAFDFAERVYRFTNRYPETELRRLMDQSCRAAIYFLRVSAGSAAELETHLLLAVRLGYATPTELQPLLLELRRIRRMIDALARTLIPRAEAPVTECLTRTKQKRPSIPNASRRPNKHG